MPISPSIFKAYDIRGIVGQTLTEAAAEQIGRAIATRAARQGLRQIAVGRDGRLSGWKWPMWAWWPRPCCISPPCSIVPAAA